MKRKYVKLNDGYSHLSLGNVINVIKEESKNKSSAIQGEIFCAIFSVDYVNNSTVNNYCIGSRGIGDNYKQIYINLRKKFDKDAKKWAVSLKDWANAEKERRIEKNSKEAEEMASKKALEFNPLAVKPEISAPKLINK